MLYTYRAGSLYTRGGQRKYLTPRERHDFIEAAEQCSRPDLRTLCLTLAYTGCRISEALALTVASIELEAEFIAIRTLKRRNGAVSIREVPVPRRLLDDLAIVHDLAETDKSVRLWNLSRSQAWRLVKSIMKAAHVTDGQHATCKGLRHGYGLHAARHAVPLSLIQRWLGHSSIESTMCYLQLMGDEERAFAAKLWATSESADAVIS